MRQPQAARAEFPVAIDDSEASAASIVSGVGSCQNSAAIRRPIEEPRSRLEWIVREKIMLLKFGCEENFEFSIAAFDPPTRQCLGQHSEADDLSISGDARSVPMTAIAVAYTRCLKRIQLLGRGQRY